MGLVRNNVPPARRTGRAQSRPAHRRIGTPRAGICAAIARAHAHACVGRCHHLAPPVTVSPYELLGGDAGVRALVDRFYDEMDAAPAAASIRAMHPADLASSREKLWLFLCGWLGGPPRYVERFGHPRLRARHLPFTIGGDERDQWMACMRTALATCVDDAQLRASLDQALAQLADHMRNRVE
ncbi:MAG: group II truncated hemoglobin [Deltaproteobacteria bacterium]|nr:group II truncated hemoglobin [Deltaproteobacteria bacterium]MBK8718193.1 group II truncated hemoglobin [Deltaproteobacteria bacterium]